jgi:glycerol-3-phosphate dehydrogenase
VNHSVILRAQDKRVFFVINVGDVSRVGTTERIYSDPDTLEPLEEEIEYLLGALERYFPAQKFTTEDILSKDAGIRPLAKPKGDADPHGISREHEIRIGPTGVMHVLGVKLTDHRRAAEDIMNRITRELKREKPNVKLKTSTHQIPLKN